MDLSRKILAVMSSTGQCQLQKHAINCVLLPDCHRKQDKTKSRKFEEGQVTMPRNPVKSLVSEQYLDGWSYDDDEEDGTDEEKEDKTTSSSAPEKSTKNQTTPSLPVKRPHSQVEPEKGSEQEGKKKISMTLNSRLTGNSTFSFGSKKNALTIQPTASKLKAAPIKMNLSTQSKPLKEAPLASSSKKSSAVAKAFAADSDESEEEMPPEARMRMRNIGRETPTAAGPNSFGKGRLGFCDRQKIIERKLQTEDSD